MPTLQDNYNTGDNITGWDIYANNAWVAEVFTASGNYDAESIKLKIVKVGSPTGDITVSLRAVSGGLPTGADLASGTISATTVADTTPDWYEITFGTPLELADGTDYAWVLRLAGGDNGNKIQIRLDTTSGYSNGSGKYSTDGGSNWNATGDDFLFELWGTLLTIQISVSDTFSLSEAKTLNQESKVSDTINLSENISALRALVVSVSDTLNLSEAMTALRTFIVSFSDTIGISEVITAIFKWRFKDKNTTTWTQKSKPTTSWTQKSKNSTNWTFKSK